MSAGENHSLALRSDGVVYAWGNLGMAGDGTGNLRRSPVTVAIPNTVTITAIEAGQSHSLALDSTGTVWGWGYNGNGQLANGTWGTSVFTPTTIPLFSPAIAISGGAAHSLVVKVGGTVWGSGLNNTGQLGDGSTGFQLSPVQMTGVTGAVKVAAGMDYSVVLLGNGEVWGVGANGYGQLCTNTGNRTTALPTPLSGMVSISAGRQHFLASEGGIAGGDLWACGRNPHGELGNGNTTPPYAPFIVPSFSDMSSISAGPNHTAVLKTVLGTTYVWTWGRNFYGQLGDGGTTNSTTPLLVWTY